MASMLDGDNRRRHRRSRVRVLLQLGSATLADTNGFTRDLSIGGASIVTDDPLPDYSMINVTLSAEDNSEQVTVEARVLWCRPMDEVVTKSTKYLAGIQFMNLHTGMAKQTITSLMKRKPKK